jgi:hypothetical protein
MTETCNACGALALVGETESHEESLLAVKAKLPPPALETFTVDAAGFVPLPCVAVNDKVVGNTDNAGAAVGEATLKVTVMVAGELWAPAAVTVRWPV